MRRFYIGTWNSADKIKIFMKVGAIGVKRMIQRLEAKAKLAQTTLRELNNLYLR